MNDETKMPAVLLAGLMILALGGCEANQTNPQRRPGAGQRNKKKRKAPATETTKKTAPLPPPTENKTEATAEKEKAESSAPAESGTAAETRKPAESADKAETVPPTQAPKQSEPPEATEPQPTAPPESRPAETTAPTTPPTETKPETEPPAEIQPPKGFTEADHTRIVSEVKAYAESYKAKGFTFEWSDSFGIRLGCGLDGNTLYQPRRCGRYDQDPQAPCRSHLQIRHRSANGVTADSVLYRVVQLEIDGGIAYAVIYG